MQIYTGNAFGGDFERVKELGMGIMISTSTGFEAGKRFKEVPCALDNGAFTAFQKGYPFQAERFRQNISHCYQTGIPLNFIACPDLVQGGWKSFEYSMKWAKDELLTAPRLALVVQDGMNTVEMPAEIHQYFTHIFVGGSVDWKWSNAQDWVMFAHDTGMKCHIGQVGQLGNLITAWEIGADSVDSTSIVRNKSWHIIEAFYEHTTGRQEVMFNEG